MDEDREAVGCANERATAQVGAIFTWEATNATGRLGHGVDGQRDEGPVCGLP
jgi:hypothetical protein